MGAAYTMTVTSRGISWSLTGHGYWVLRTADLHDLGVTRRYLLVRGQKHHERNSVLGESNQGELPATHHVVQGAALEDQEEVQDPGLVHGAPKTWPRMIDIGSSWQS